MRWLRPPKWFRASWNGAVVLSVAALVLGSALSPLCACLCEAVTMPGEAEGHAHHEDTTPREPAAGHSDETAGCDRLAGTLPSATTLAAAPFDVGLQSMVATRPSGTLWDLSTTLACSSPAPCPDRGPPIPLPLFAILRL